MWGPTLVGDTIALKTAVSLHPKKYSWPEMGDGDWISREPFLRLAVFEPQAGGRGIPLAVRPRMSSDQALNNTELYD